MIRNRQRPIDVLLDDDQSHVLLFQQPQRLVEPVHHHGRQTKTDLVENHQPGTRHQGAADRQHLLLPARHRRSSLMLSFRENREKVIDRIEPVAHLVRRRGPGRDQ